MPITHNYTPFQFQDQNKILMFNNQKKEGNRMKIEHNWISEKLKLSFQHSLSKDHSPVDDAIPARLPQDRLTRTVESWGLIKS